MATELSHPATICIGCWQWLRLPIPLRGVASLPFRLFGIRPSRMNPNTCTICELMFTRIMKAKKLTIDASILFADLRGYSALSEAQSPEAVSRLLDAFYDDCAGAIWDGDGLLIKTMGDSVMAIFNFPILRDDHARRAFLTAREIRRRWNQTRETFVADNGASALSTGIGIGVASGKISFGEFGQAPVFDAIGNVVNTASRAQSVAAADEILLTEAVYEHVPKELVGGPAKEYHLKGFARSTLLYAA